MKIDEPDTPFERAMPDPEEEEEEEDQRNSGEGKASFKLDLMSRLENAAEEINGGAERRDQLWETADEEKERQQNFRAKRNQHYNEFEMMKKWRAEHADDDEEDEDEEEESEGTPTILSGEKIREAQDEDEDDLADETGTGGHM